MLFEWKIMTLFIGRVDFKYKVWALKAHNQHRYRTLRLHTEGQMKSYCLKKTFYVAKTAKIMSINSITIKTATAAPTITNESSNRIVHSSCRCDFFRLAFLWIKFACAIKKTFQICDLLSDAQTGNKLNTLEKERRIHSYGLPFI